MKWLVEPLPPEPRKFTPPTVREHGLTIDAEPDASGLLRARCAGKDWSHGVGVGTLDTPTLDAARALLKRRYVERHAPEIPSIVRDDKAFVAMWEAMLAQKVTTNDVEREERALS